MKKFFLMLLLVAFFIVGVSSKTLAVEEKTHNNNAVTGFYGVYESSTSETTESTTKEKEPETSTKTETNTNTIVKSSNTIYEEKIPLTGDTTYHLQMIVGVITMGLAIYLIRKNKKHTMKEGLL